MALEECPACQKAISVKARSCTNCGEPLAAGWDAPVVRRRLKSRGWKTIRILFFVFVVIPVGINLFKSDDKEQDVVERKNVTATTEPSLVVPKSSDPQATALPAPDTNGRALVEMAQVFVGHPGEDDIRHYMDRALVSYGEPVNELSYRRAGSALVVMRKDTSIPEMDILRCIVEANAGEYGTFADMAAVCATILVK